MITHRGQTLGSLPAMVLLLAWGLGVAEGFSSPAWARDVGELRKRASWEPLTVEQVQQQLDQWLQSTAASEGAREKVAALWNMPPDQQAETGLLDRVVASIAAVEPRGAEVQSILQSGSSAIPAKFPWLGEEQTAEFVRNNLRLAYGRWLAQHSHFDEALEQLSGLTVEQVVDPAALLFYQSVAFHRLLKKEECLQALDKLLENEPRLPRRYATIAKLMDADIRPLKTDSLDEIARLMSDIRRRLNFGHAGTRVRKQEDDVIAKLDKKIKDIEDQMAKAAAAGQQGQGSTQPTQPAEESQNLGGKGPGDVDQKNIGSKAGWGNLPPKEREQALQQISKDLPAHYREAIEEYFRKLARDGDEMK